MFYPILRAKKVDGELRFFFDAASGKTQQHPSAEDAANAFREIERPVISHIDDVSAAPKDVRYRAGVVRPVQRSTAAAIRSRDIRYHNTVIKHGDGSMINLTDVKRPRCCGSSKSEAARTMLRLGFLWPLCTEEVRMLANEFWLYLADHMPETLTLTNRSSLIGLVGRWKSQELDTFWSRLGATAPTVSCVFTTPQGEKFRPGLVGKYERTRPRNNWLKKKKKKK